MASDVWGKDNKGVWRCGEKTIKGYGGMEKDPPPPKKKRARR